MNNKTLNITITEMCDVCGKDCISPIPRTQYLTKRNVLFIIRHHIGCDPIKFAINYLEY